MSIDLKKLKNLYLSENGLLVPKYLIKVFEILVLKKLTSEKERIIGSKWVAFFNQLKDRKELAEFVPLLHFLMRKLCRQPFVVPFGWSAPILHIDENFNSEVAKQLCKDYMELEDEVEWRGSNDTEVHIDTQEFLAFQKLSFFGAHFYYAFSPNERVQNWPQFKKFTNNKNLKILDKMQKISDQMI